MRLRASPLGNSLGNLAWLLPLTYSSIQIRRIGKKLRLSHLNIYIVKNVVSNKSRRKNWGKNHLLNCAVGLIFLFMLVKWPQSEKLSKINCNLALGNLAWLLPLYYSSSSIQILRIGKKSQVQKFNSFKYVVSNKSSFHKNWDKFRRIGKKNQVQSSSHLNVVKFVSFKYQCCKNMACLINFATKIEAKLLF